MREKRFDLDTDEGLEGFRAYMKAAHERGSGVNAIVQVSADFNSYRDFRQEMIRAGARALGEDITGGRAHMIFHVKQPPAPMWQRAALTARAWIGGRAAAW